MEQPLFQAAKISFEKTAAGSRLEDDVDIWPVEIIKNAYKQLPWLKSHEVEVDLENVDSARGYAVGKMVIYPAQMKKSAAAEQKRILSVPLIIRSRDLSPLDTYMYEKLAYPMDEEKVEEILFRPDTFKGPAPKGGFGSVPLAGQLRPPADDQYWRSGSINKSASVRPTLLEAVSPTFRDEDVESFKGALLDDAALRHAFLTRGHLKEAAECILTVKEKTAAAMQGYRRSITKPTAVQFISKGTGFQVKTANHKCYRPQESFVSRFTAQKMLSEESFEKLQENGILTVTVDPVVHGNLTEKVAQEANRTGVYRVWAGGKQIEGVVIPRMISFDERPLDLQIFSSGTSHALQEKVAGVFVEDVHLEDVPPRGRGVFVYQSGPKAMATEPIRVDVKSSIDDGKEKVAHIHGTILSTGLPVRITLVKGLQKIARLGDDEVALPSSFQWVPLKGEQISLPRDSQEAQELESIKIASADMIDVLSDGTTFSFRGRNASVFGRSMDSVDTEFSLATLGLTDLQAHSVMKTASRKGVAKVAHTRRVVSEDDLKVAAMSKVASHLRSLPNLRVDLVKEASVIMDKETADAVLSLGFVTPENTAIYVDYLPDLEKTSSRLAELLVASRLGMDDVREAATKNAMVQVNMVINGLRSLQSKIQ